MYLREVKRRNKDGGEVVYYQLAETLYDRGKRQPRVRIVHSFGRSDTVDPAALRRLSASLLKVCGRPEEPCVTIERTYDLGLLHLVGSLWESLGIGQALRVQMQARPRDRHPFDRLLMALTAFRLNDPAAKRGCYEYWLPQQVWLPEARDWELEAFYRTMDFYRENANAVEALLFRALQPEAADLVFLDLSLLKIVTGEGPMVAASASAPPAEERALVKIWAGLAVSLQGLPIRTWAFPEGTSRESALGRMEADLKAMGLTRIACIGEAAAGEAPAQAERSLIWATPLTDARHLKEKALGRAGSYRALNDQLEIKVVRVNAGSHRRRYVICRNPEEARQKRAWRGWVLKLLASELRALDPMKAGYGDQVRELRYSRLFRSYLRLSRAKQLALDTVKINREARMDGKSALTTNDDALTPEEIAHSEQGNKVAKEFFRQARIMGLRPRPMFHLSLHRIESHVRLCFLIILVQRHVEFRSGRTWEEVRRILETCKVVHFRIGAEDRFQQTRPGEDLLDLMQRLGVPAQACIRPPGSS